MKQSISARERDFHRKIASKCFNEAWDYLHMKKKSVADEILMLNLAHTSYYHWGLVGTPRNRAVGAWQLSRVYADIGEPELALKFAKVSLEMCETNHLTEVMHTSNEAIARSYAVAKDPRKAMRYLNKAKSQLDKLSLGPEDKQVYLDQLNETRSLIRNH